MPFKPKVVENEGSTEEETPPWDDDSVDPVWSPVLGVGNNITIQAAFGEHVVTIETTSDKSAQDTVDKLRVMLADLAANSPAIAGSFMAIDQAGAALSKRAAPAEAAPAASKATNPNPTTASPKIPYCPHKKQNFNDCAGKRNKNGDPYKFRYYPPFGCKECEGTDG